MNDSSNVLFDQRILKDFALILLGFSFLKLLCKIDMQKIEKCMDI